MIDRQRLGVANASEWAVAPLSHQVPEPASKPPRPAKWRGRPRPRSSSRAFVIRRISHDVEEEATGLEYITLALGVDCQMAWLGELGEQPVSVSVAMGQA